MSIALSSRAAVSARRLGYADSPLSALQMLTGLATAQAVPVVTGMTCEFGFYPASNNREASIDFTYEFRAIVPGLLSETFFQAGNDTPVEHQWGNRPAWPYRFQGEYFLAENQAGTHIIEAFRRTTAHPILPWHQATAKLYQRTASGSSFEIISADGRCTYEGAKARPDFQLF